MLDISFLLSSTHFLVTERITHLWCCRRSRPSRAWPTGPSCLKIPDTPCYQPGIFFLSHVRNQTSRGTMSEYSRHVVRSEGYNQASCRVCPRFIQSRCSLISQDEPERALQDEPPIFSIP
ncbi:hypothetical protein VPH35_123312 [Triticum aestivum]